MIEARPATWERAAGARLASRTWLIPLLAGFVVMAGAIRLTAGGWATAAPDDARYVFVGLRVLDGAGPVTPDGALFVLRSPVYGVALAVGSRLLGGDPFVGAGYVAAALALLALGGAVVLAGRLGGPIGAIVCGVATLATPLPWTYLPTLRIDQAQTAAMVATLLVASRVPPSMRRAFAVGALVGLTVLVKEAALPLVVLPIAWWAVTGGRWIRLALAAGCGMVVVAAWWWVVVWLATGRLFPLEALDVIDTRQVAEASSPRAIDVVVMIAAVAGWLGVVVRARSDPTLRPLLVTGLALLPAAALAWRAELDARNFLPLAVLSGVALGIAASTAAAGWRAMTAATGSRTRPANVAASIVVGAIALAAVGVGQGAARPPSRVIFPDRLVATLRPELPAGSAIAMTFRYREVTAVELYRSVGVRSVFVDGVPPDAVPADFLWFGVRDRQLFGLARSTWVTVLGDPSVTRLVIVEPHPLAPVELLPSLEGASLDSVGVRFEHTIATPGVRGHVYVVAPGAVGTGHRRLSLHVQPDAVLAWLRLTGADGAARLVAARPIIAAGTGRDQALAALEPFACVEPADVGEDWVRVIPRGDGDCPRAGTPSTRAMAAVS